VASAGSGSTTYAASYAEKRSQKADEHCAKTECFSPPIVGNVGTIRFTAEDGASKRERSEDSFLGKGPLFGKIHRLRDDA